MLNCAKKIFEESFVKNVFNTHHFQLIFAAIRLIYKNVWVARGALAQTLVVIISLIVFYESYVFYATVANSGLGFPTSLAILAGCLPLVVYFLAVPCLLYLVDREHNGSRIDALSTWPNFKKKHFGKY